MRTIYRGVLFTTIMIVMISACKRNKSTDPSPESPIEVGGGDQENITRLVLRLINESDTSYATFKDPNGNGTNLTIDTLRIDTSKTYKAEVKIYDDTKNPSAIISNEILSEANYHRFHYIYTADAGSLATISTTITDQDSNNPPQPIGLTFNLVTGSKSGHGKLKANLRHFGTGETKNSDPAGGEQDLLVEFPVKVK